MRGFKTHRVPPGPRSPTPKANQPDNSPKGSHGHHPPACHNLRRPFSAPAAPQCNRPERAGAGWNMGVWLKGGPLDTVPSRQRTRLFDDLGFFGVPHTKYVKPAPTAAVGSKMPLNVWILKAIRQPLPVRLRFSQYNMVGLVIDLKLFILC